MVRRTYCPRRRRRLLESWNRAEQPQRQVQSRLLLDVVVRQRAPLIQLLPRKNQPLFALQDARLGLDLCFRGIDRVRWLHVERDRLALRRVLALVPMSLHR